MTIRPHQAALLAALFAMTPLQAFAQDIVLHNGDSISNLKKTLAGDNPEAVLEENTDTHFVSEGTGSIHIHSVVPENSSDTSYVGFRFPVDSIRLEGCAIAFEAWSSEPEHTRAFYVRGFNSKGKIVASWVTWSRPFSPAGQTMLLVSNKKSGQLEWEEDRIQAPEDEIVSLEFIIGSKAQGCPFNAYIDHIRLVSAGKASE